MPRSRTRTRAVCAPCLGSTYLREVDEEDFCRQLPAVRAAAGDRAVLRAMHVYDENRRVRAEVQALRAGDFARFLALVNASGDSSWEYLQNITPAGAAARQDMALTLALCRRLLAGTGAVRVHGGGFAGTALSIVPEERIPCFTAGLERALAPGLLPRAAGGVISARELAVDSAYSASGGASVPDGPNERRSKLLYFRPAAAPAQRRFCI